MALNKGEVEHLYNLQHNDIISNEANIYPTLENQDTILNFEVKRSILRLNCFLLLLDGTEKAYNEFVQNQFCEKDICLKFGTFQQFSSLLKDLSVSAKEALRASCFIKMTKEYRERATQEGINYSTDSEKFISDIIEKLPSLFPAYNTLSEQSKNLMPFVFLKDSHARHMQLCEGCENMFAVLSQKAKEGEIDLDKNFERFKVWFIRWIIEDSAFEILNKNPNTQQICFPQGSSNFKQHVALDYLYLLNEIKKLINQKGIYSVFSNYLSMKANQLGIENIILAQIAVQSRLSSAEDIKKLNEWFHSLASELKTQYQEIHAQFCKSIESTPTYEPAVIKNLLLKEKLELPIALSIYAEIITKVHSIYLKKLGKNIDPITPINFNSFLYYKNGEQLSKVVAQYITNKKIPLLDIDKSGVVFLVSLPLAHSVDSVKLKVE